MSTLFQGHFVQFFDGNGVPLSGGEVDFYAPGTSTPKDVYTDSDLSTPATNPVTLDAEGRATVWLNGDYKVRLKKSDGTVVKTTDNVNPPADTETSGGNLIANGSFETQGNSSTDASGWTLTAQSDGSVERITSDNYDGTAALKFTSDGSGGGQADTNAFFPVSPGRSYEISFALKCSVSDIRNIVQVRYFDEDQQFLSNSTVYDEDAANPTSWTVKSFFDTPPTNARFAKLRILGADQSDATSGEAKFDSVSARNGDAVTSRFPNVDADVTASDEELNKLDGYPGEIPTGGWKLIESQTASGDSSLDFTGLDGSYIHYMFVFDRVYFSGSAKLYARVSTDSGSTWDSGASDYLWRFLQNDATSTNNTAGDSEIELTAEFGNSVLKGEVVLEARGGEGDVSIDYPIISSDLRLSTIRWWCMGRRDTDVTANGVRFLPSAGSISGGTVYLYGWVDGS